MSRNVFGWDLPPGCSMRDIDRACGDGWGDEECREDCMMCAKPLDEDNQTGLCLPPADCMMRLEMQNREDNEAEARYYAEEAKWAKEFDEEVLEHHQDQVVWEDKHDYEV